MKKELKIQIKELLIKKWYVIVFLLLLNCFIIFAGDTFRGDDFGSSLVDTDEKIVQNDERTGYLIYGPYASYEKGEYSVCVYGNTNTKNHEIDVFSGTVGEKLYEGELELGKAVSFTLEQPVTDLEIRVKYAGTGTLEIKKVTVKKTIAMHVYVIMLILDILFFACFCFERDEKSEDKRYIAKALGIQFIRLCSLSFLVIMMTEYIRNERMLLILSWVEGATKRFAMNLFVVLIIVMLIYFLCRNMGITTLVGGTLFFVLAFVDYNYYKIRGESFKLSELLLAGEAADVIDGYTIEMPLAFPMALVILVLCAFGLGFKRNKINIYARISGICICLLLAVGFYKNVEDVITLSGGDPGVYITRDFYENYGYILGLVRTLPQGVEKPKGYSKKNIQKLVEEAETSEYADVQVYPNIIYIQNESLYDLELIAERKWSEDPLAGLKELQEEYTSGMLISPTSGGGTCNVEYEVLTGYPYFNTGGTPFTNLIQNGTESMVSILSSQGYQTEAMHLNTGGFFNRKVVYSNLGFDKAVFSEDVSGVPKEEYYNEVWVSDKCLYLEVIKEFESRDRRKPYFAHIVTTQNHGPYSYTYDWHGITVQAEMNPDEKRCLQTYVNAEKESVEALKMLLEYFKNISEPTIVVFWGDHCPGFSMLGISTDDSMENYTDTHLTPLLVWNNYGLEKDELGTISAYNISPYILNLVGIHTDSYMNYLYNKNVPNVLNEIEVLDRRQFQYVNDWDEQKKTIWNNAWQLQYDRIFGKKYSLR